MNVTMKKLILTLFAVLSAATAMAQEKAYRPFCEEGKTWVSQLVSAIDPSYIFNTSVHVLSGDTLIDNRTCKKVMAYLGVTGGLHYAGAFYEDQKKVYYYRPTSTTPVLLYDFATPEGGSIDVGCVFTVVVAKDSYTTGERPLLDRSLGFLQSELLATGLIESSDDPDLLQCGLWREGVGNLLGTPVKSIYNHFEPTGLTSEVLLSCSVGDEYLFLREESRSWVEKVMKVGRLELLSKSSTVCDISGRNVNTSARGLYIKNGKKILK